MNLYRIAKQYWGQTICVRLDDGKGFRGKLVNYESEADNDSGIESIIIDTVDGILIELSGKEIEEIELI